MVHDDVDVAGQRLLKLPEHLTVGRQQHVVGVQPQDIILCGPGKGRVARRRKVVVPRKIVNQTGVLCRNLLSLIGAAGVDDDDFIDNLLHAVQAARQNRLFILDNHAQADGDHRCPPCFEFSLLHSIPPGALLCPRGPLFSLFPAGATHLPDKKRGAFSRRKRPFFNFSAFCM